MISKTTVILRIKMSVVIFLRFVQSDHHIEVNWKLMNSLIICRKTLKYLGMTLQMMN
jgi:hypothetical protein